MLDVEIGIGDQTLAWPADQWEVVFFQGGSTAEGTLVDKHWELATSTLLDTALFNDLKERLPAVTRMYGDNLNLAMRRLERIGRRAPTLVNAGRALWAIGNLDDSKPLLEEAVEVDPSYIPSRLALAQLALHEGDYEKAYFMAVELTSDETFGASAVTIAADAAFRSSDVATALDLLLSASRRWKDNPSFQFNAGIALVSQGKTRDAAGMFRRALRIDPFFSEAYHGFALCYIQQGLFRKAVTQFNLDSFVERPVRDGPWSARVSGREAPRAVGC